MRALKTCYLAFLEFMKDKITENTTLAELLESPKAQKILAKYNLPCLGCPFAKFEMDATHPPPHLKIGEVCKMYGIDIESLLKELNEKLK